MRHCALYILASSNTPNLEDHMKAISYIFVSLYLSVGFSQQTYCERFMDARCATDGGRGGASYCSRVMDANCAKNPGLGGVIYCGTVMDADCAKNPGQGRQAYCERVADTRCL